MWVVLCADSFGQMSSGSDLLGNDMFSFDQSHLFDDDDDYERLSEFDEVVFLMCSHGWSCWVIFPFCS